MNKEKFLYLDNAFLEAKKVVDTFEVKTNLIIGGGAVRDFIFDLGDKPKDFDVYVYPEDKSMATKEFFCDARRKLINYFSEVYCVLKDSHIDSLQDGTLLFSDDSHFTVKILDALSEDFEVPFQFLYKNNTNSPQDIIDQFDLDICQFGYDGKDLYYGSDIEVKEVLKALFKGGPVSLMRSSSTYTRLKTFKERYGCDIEQAVEDLQKAWSTDPDATPAFIGEPAGDANRFYWASPLSSLEDM